MPTLYLMLGYPGAGKTTVSKKITELTGAAHIWADHERRNKFENPTHSKEESDELYAELNQRTDELLAAGKSVVFDTNFNYFKDREHLRSIAEKNGAKTVLVWLTTPLEIAEHRAVHDSLDKENRVWGNMHHDDFRRIAEHLEPPKPEEKAFEIDGTDLDATIVKKLAEENS